jgi:hypothetical protein
MRWILGVTAMAVVVGLVATISIPAQTVTPDEATLKLFPPETEGIAFVDVAGLRNAPLFQDLILKNLPGALPREMQELVDATGFDVRNDVDRVTIGRTGRNSALAIAQARYDKFKLEQFITDKADDDLVTETYLGRVIYKGDNDDHPGSFGVAFIDNLIVGGSLPSVKQAIDRMAAPAPNVFQNTELMNDIRTIDAGHQIWAVGKIDIGPFGGRGPAEKLGQMAGQLKSGTYQMRIDQDVHAKVTGSFGSAEMAKATNDMLRGLLTVAKLQLANEEKLVRLLDGVAVESSNEKLTVTVNARGDQLKELEQIAKGLHGFK